MSIFIISYAILHIFIITPLVIEFFGIVTAKCTHHIERIRFVGQNSKTDDSETIHYVNDINLTYEQVLQTYDDSGNVLNTYTYGVERIQSVGETNETYLYDGRGSVVGTINDEEILTSYHYTAYGNLLPKSPSPKVFGYNAEQVDNKTGLAYLRARYYDTNTGRFISKDIWRGDYTEPVSLNRYAYVYNDPVNYVDISGYTRARVSSNDGRIKDVDTLTDNYNTNRRKQLSEKARSSSNAGSNSSAASNNSNLVFNPYSDVIGAEKVTREQMIYICEEYARIMKEEAEEEYITYNQQLFFDIINNLSAAFISSETIYQQVLYADEVYITLNGVSSGVPKIFKFTSNYGAYGAVITNVISGFTADSVTMQYSYLSTIGFSANPYTSLGSSLINSTKSYFYDISSEENQRYIDWATATRGYTDTVAMPPWLMEEALEGLDEEIDELIKDVGNSIDRLNEEMSDAGWSSEYFYFHMN